MSCHQCVAQVDSDPSFATAGLGEAKFQGLAGMEARDKKEACAAKDDPKHDRYAQEWLWEN